MVRNWEILGVRLSEAFQDIDLVEKTRILASTVIGSNCARSSGDTGLMNAAKKH